MNQYMKKIIQNYGLIVAGIGILYTAIAYLTGNPGLFTIWYLGLSVGLLGIVIEVIGVTKYKASQGGFMSFKEGFTVYFMIALVATLVSTLFSLLIFNVVDPEFADLVNNEILETTISRMEGFGTPEEVIKRTMEQMEESGGQFTAANQLKSMAYAMIFNAVVGLIVAAFTKKARPLVMDDEETTAEA